MITCPACGQPITGPRTSVEALVSAPMSTVRRTIVRVLIDRYPLDISAEALLAEIYSGSREPEFSHQALRVQLRNIRQILRPYGWTIPPAAGGRGNAASYKLEPLP